METTGGSAWSSGSGPEIEAAFREVLETVNARYVLAYEPTGVRRSGRHRIELKVRRAERCRSAGPPGVLRARPIAARLRPAEALNADGGMIMVPLAVDQARSARS